jgi:hypothetical protein
VRISIYRSGGRCSGIYRLFMEMKRLDRKAVWHEVAEKKPESS